MTTSDAIKRAVLLALASLALLKLGALAAYTAGRWRVPDIDATVLGMLNAWRTPALDSLFGALTWAGSLYVLLPLALLLMFTDKRGIPLQQRGFVVLALASNWGVIHIAKLLVARPRPHLFEPLIALPADGSFPSAHAAQITAFACAWLLRPGARPAWPLAALLCVLVFGVCLSRLYLQVHYPSDVFYAVASTVLWVLALRALCDGVGRVP